MGKENDIFEAMLRSIDNLPIELSDIDKQVMATWGYIAYMDGWNNAKILLVKKNDK